MLKVTSYSTSPNKLYNQSFKANVNTRQLIENFGSDDHYNNGRPRIERIGKDKRAHLLSQKFRIGDGLVYRTCTRKNRYDSENAAMRAIRYLSRKVKEPLTFYECPLCEGWHLCKVVNKYTKKIPI